MSSEANSAEVSRIKVYKGSGAKGYYYAIDKKGDSRLIPQQDKVTFVLDENKYEIISAADARTERARLRKEHLSVNKEVISYDDVNVDEVVMKISLKNIKETAAKHDFNLSSRAVEAYRNIFTSCEDIENTLEGYRKQHPNMNFIDFDVRSKRFNISHKNVTNKKTSTAYVSKVDQLAEQLSTTNISDN